MGNKDVQKKLKKTVGCAGYEGEKAGPRPQAEMGLDWYTVFFSLDYWRARFYDVRLV